MPDYLKEVILYNSLRIIAVFCFIIVAINFPLTAVAIIAASVIGVTLMAYLVAEIGAAEIREEDKNEHDTDDE